MPTYGCFLHLCLCLLLRTPTFLGALLHLLSLRFLMWVPLLQTHLVLCLGAQPCPGHLEKVKSKPKLLLIRHLTRLLFHVGGHTSCQLTLHCVWVLCLIFVTFPLVGAPLANSPCLAFGHPALFSLRFLMHPSCTRFASTFLP
jgi:hypothetical protein